MADEYSKKVDQEYENLKARQEAQERFNKEQVKSQTFSDKIRENLAEHASLIDKSGTLSQLFKKNLDGAQKASLGMQLSFSAIVAAALKGSDLINKIQKSTGMAYGAAQKFQNELAVTATQSEKLYVNSTELNKALTSITAQTGLFADFGGDTLVTFTTLNKQLGLAEEQSGKLSLLARLQSKDTEGILSNTVDTVSAISKQNGVAINAKAILEDISSASSAIVVSLGMNPELLAEAAAEAKLLGANLAIIDQIAGSILNFESSIESELTAELLTGKQLNFEKARLLALNNDLAGLTEEIKNNEALTSEFASGNRLEQQAIADAIGLSRDAMADLVMGQEFARLGAENFKDEYGEVAYNQMAAMSASEKFAEVVTKVQGIIGDMGTVLAPIIDGFAAIVGYLAQSKTFAVGLVGVLSGLAVKSIITGIASIYTGMAPLGPPGIIGATAIAAGMMASISAASSIYADDMAYGNNKLVTKDKGTIHLNNNDTVIAGTNLGGGGEVNIDYNKMANAISKIQVNTTTQYDSFKAKNQSSNHGSYQSDIRHQTKFA